MKKIAIVGACVGMMFMLSGCADMMAAQKAGEDARSWLFVNAPLKFDTQKECDKYWNKTKLAIRHNSNMKIQSSDDAFIETYNPPAWNATTGLKTFGTAEREMQDNGSCIITVKMSNNLFDGAQDDVVTVNVYKEIKG